MRGLQIINLTLDEYEAFRLADYLNLDQESAAHRMEISRPTFTRLIESARNKIADFLVNGRSLQIEGGSIHFQMNLIKCRSCGAEFTLDMSDEMFIKCPVCGSTDLLNLASNFGHGRCCYRNRRGHR